MNLNYRNPTSPITSLGNVSAPLDVTYGTNYSVLSTGGYMEVYNLNDLDYVIPIGQTGLIEFSANTIPIQFNKGLGTVFSPDVLTLHSDNISSGRRKLGMLVYVYETKNIYQYTIDNYDNLWTAATTSSGLGGPTVVISEFGTTVRNNSIAGQNFINAWTASTIEGISGYNSTNASWRIFKGSPFSGGTVFAPTIFTGGLSATTFSAGTYLGLPLDVYTTGSTLVGDTIYFDRNDLLSAYSVSLSAFTPTTDIYTTGATLINDVIYFDRNDLLSAYTVSLSSFTPTVDVFVTGGTYSAGTATFTNNTGGTFDVSGFYTGDTNDNIFVTAFTYSSNTLTIFDNSGNTFPVTINEFTGLTINGDLSATTISGGTFYGDGSNLTGIVGEFTGGTVTGDTVFSLGLTATTISATTYQNLPIDPDTYVTGFTYSANTFTIFDNSGNTFNATIDDVTGFTINGDLSVTGNSYFNGLSANTISATTYLNLPTDFNTFVTGFTYSSNTFTIFDNSGNTFDANFNEVSGLTVNGDFTVTGDTLMQGLSAFTVSADTYQNLPIDPDTYTTGFTYSSNTFTIYDNSGSTFTVNVNDFTGLTINGNFNVTGTSQLDGQISSLSLSGVTDRLVQVDGSGIFTATQQIVSAYISSASTAASLLIDVNNWDINGNYTGMTSITGTFQGQKYYDNNYFFEAVQDNIFIRLIRG